MRSLRFWVLTLAGTAFLAGSAAGLLLGTRLAPPAPPRGPFADYADLLTASYDLPPDRERILHAVLDRYHRDLEELKARHVAQAEPELVRLGETCRQRIRDYVLTEEERAGFTPEARLSDPRSLSWAAPSGPGG